MKKQIVLISLLFCSIFSYSQIYDPIKWETKVEKTSENEYSLISTAILDDGWHLYSQNVPENGPIPTAFSYKTSKNYKLIGSTSEEKGEVVDDPVFEMKIKYFSKKATFIQKIEVKEPIDFQIIGEVEFMVCDDTNCLPPTFVDLEFKIEKDAPIVVSNDYANVSDIDFNTVSTNESQTGEVSDKSSYDSSRSLWSIFLIAFFSGFAALLTPCVFPMIPMTVSFFTKQSKNRATGIRNAIVYGISIVIIYVVLGLLVSVIFGPNALNALSTNPWFNVIFFLLLLVFAISFLGAFELTLPSSWGTKADAQADKGGLIGIFFMALALAIVSFSCTGPIVGYLLVDAAVAGNQIGPVIGMLGFSLAIAIPFALFAAFPGWLNTLPKSGGWLNTVKVVLGFLELALAFKFLSNADLVLQLHWLEREVFLAIWIAIFGTLAFYLFGKIQLPHDSPQTNISVGRLSLGLVSLAFTIYMIPGLWGAPLNLISAFPPAQHYAESPYGVGFTKQSVGINSEPNGKIPEGAHYMAPHNILAFNDYDKGLAYAKEVNKPVLIDFTGHACVNCRKMEQNVWAKEEVLTILKNDVVLISLYVDDNRLLPKGEEIESKLQPGKKLKYIGQKWSEFQTITFGANAQPFYVLINHNGEKLIEPIAYTPDVEVYKNWLQSGIEKF